MERVEPLHHLAGLVDDGQPRPQLLLGDPEDLELVVTLTQLLVDVVDRLFHLQLGGGDPVDSGPQGKSLGLE